MDKGKNRSDLLAAGRKKLQQYRKKNNKGSSNNSGNSKDRTSDKRTDPKAAASNSNLASDNESKEKFEDDSGEVLVNLTADEQNSGSDPPSENQIPDTETVENETLEDKRDREDASVDQEIAQAGSENQIHEITVMHQMDLDVNNPDPKPESKESNAPQFVPNEEILINSGENEKLILPQDGIESIESIKRELYLSAIANDSMKLQLDEQTGFNNEMSKLVKKTEEELVKCRSELQEAMIAKEGLGKEIIDKDSMKLQLDEQTGLNNELSKLIKETEAELIQCRSELQGTIIAKDSIQLQLDEQTGLNNELSNAIKETEAQLMQCKSELHETIIAKEKEKDKFEHALFELKSKLEEQERENVLVKEEREKLEREREILSSENTKLCTGLDRLIEENVFLCTSLDLHKLLLIESEEKSNQISPNSQFFNVHFGEVKGILGDFKNSIEKIRSGDSGSFNKRGGISNLIKAFESNSNSNSSDEVPVSEREIPEYSSREYSLESTVQLAQKLELALNQLELDIIRENKGAENHSNPISNEEHNSAIQEKIEGLSVIFNNYGARIENLQDSFTFTQKEADDVASNLSTKLEELQREVEDRVRNLLEERDKTVFTISEAISKFNSRTGLSVPADVSANLFTLVDFATQSIETLRGENKMLSDKNEVSFGFAIKLHNSLKKVLNYSDHYEGEDLKVLFESYEGLIANVQRLVEEHETLLAKNKDLESGLFRKSKEAEEFSVKCESLAENLNDFCLIKGDLESTLMSKNSILEEIYSKCIALCNQLPESSEFGEISSGDMESELLNSILPQLEASISSLLEREREEGLEIDLAKNCLYESNILSEISPDKWALPLPTLFNENLLPRISETREKLDVLSSSNLKLETEIEVLSVSNTKFETKIEVLSASNTKLEAEIEVLSASNIKFETEIEVLRDSVKQMDASIKKSETELNNKIIELEQSEQRYSSTREKLGIAVSKGKGLIVQRDGLKQNLLEISSELERCKEKLKTSTVERIEALESELSYIRNSANVMRDSFLIRDSVIQKIEEVLEEFEFPEEFYQREIVEKIEFLANMAVRRNNSREIAEDENNCREIAGDENNSREITEDENSGEMQVEFRQSSGETDELKKRYNSLERKYFEIAAHNEMLEHSLYERNGLVQKWEEIIGRVSIIPPQLSEPEERIRFLVSTVLDARTERETLLSQIEHTVLDARAEKETFLSQIESTVLDARTERETLLSKIESTFLDAQKERETLLSKIENTVLDAQKERETLLSKIESLEESSEMLIVDLEGSRKRISELNAEITGVKSEKDFFSESLNRLRFEYEVEREGVAKQLAGLRDTIKEKIEVENEILRLVDFVKNALEDCEGNNLEELSRGSSVQCLDKLIRKLLEEKNSLAQSIGNNNNNYYRSIDFDETLEEKNKSLVFEIENLNEKYEELVKERDELKEETVALNTSINLLSEERAHSSEKHHQLVAELENQRDLLQNEAQELKEKQLHEVEALNERIRELTEDRNGHLQLASELESIVKQRDALQEQYNQVREKLNVAVRKGKSLVQHRDILKQQIETLENEKSSLKQHVETLENEKSSLRQQIVTLENERSSLLSQLEASSRSLTGIQTVLNSFEISSTDPVQKLETILKSNDDLKAKAAGAENDANKSRRATELLLAELNESQERADLLQEEMERSSRKQMEGIRELNIATGKLVEASFEILESLGARLNKDVGVMSYFEAFVGSLGNNNKIDASSNFASFINTLVKEISSRKRDHVQYNASEARTDEYNENIISYVYNCVQELGDIKTNIEKEASLMDQRSDNLFESMGHAQKQVESLINNLQDEIREKEKENLLIRGEKEREFESSVAQLQRELQEKELQVSTMSAELSSQIRQGEVKINLLEKRVEDVEIEKQERVNYYTQILTKKEQEIESLMQALDEEEKEMEELETKNQKLEKLLEEKDLALKSQETSRSKTLTKLSTTITKFDELHNLSENLLSEIESLQSQLDSRDSEISFLRQEVTRITNETLSSEELNKKITAQLNHFYNWAERVVLRFGLGFEESGEFEFGRVSEYLEILEGKFVNLVGEVEELRVNLQSKDSLLQSERGKIVNLTRKCEALESSATASSSSVLEIEQSREKVMNVRGGARKANNNNNNNNNNNGDQVAIAIEMDDDSQNRPLDEDDDKAHGFRALTKSKFVPRFTRPISDRVDGIWVSGDRLLMRHPTLRLGVLLYWIALHAMLASFI